MNKGEWKDDKIWKGLGVDVRVSEGVGEVIYGKGFRQVSLNGLEMFWRVCWHIVGIRYNAKVGTLQRLLNLWDVLFIRGEEIFVRLWREDSELKKREIEVQQSFLPSYIIIVACLNPQVFRD